MPALIVREGPSAGHRVEVTGETELGRADSEFLQHDTEVSRRHAALRAGPDGLLIEDLGSSNGTFVNDQRISGPTLLRSGDVVTLGQTRFDVEVEAGAQVTSVRETVGPPPVAVPPSERIGPPPGEQPAPPPAGPSPAAAGPAQPEPVTPSGPEGPTEPQPPVAPPGPPAMPAAYGPPPSAPPPPYAPQPGPPVYGAPGGYPAGVRTGAITAAGVLLLIVGIGTLLYNGWDLFLLFQDLDLATEFGFGGILWTLIVIDAFLLLFAVLEIIGGIRSFALSRAGRALGVVGAFGVIAAWLAFLVVVMTRGLTLNALAWVVLVLSVAGSAAAATILLSSGRQFPSRT
jgi:FHA domain